MLTQQRSSAESWMRLAPSANPQSLAVLRIATAIAAIQLGRGWIRSDAALLPQELWFAPFGTRWAVGVVPVTEELATFSSLVFLGASILVLVGYRARLAAGVAVLAGLYSGWIPHLAGKVDHSHHIIWFMALLAVSPCDDQLAIRGSKSTRRAEAYALPALAGVILLGVIYLSAGIPKLETGLDWALSDNLRNLMWNLWWEKQYVAPLPVDDWPFVYQMMGLGTMVFELLFLPAALYPPTRKWIRWMGLTFHAAIWVLLTINFWTLAILYVVLFDWGGGPSDAPDTSSTTQPSIAPLALVAVISAGALLIPTGWPLSSFPGFPGIAEPEYQEFVLVGESGPLFVTRSGLATRYGPQKARPMAAGALYHDNVDALLLHVADIEGRDPDFYSEIRRIVISTHPDTPGQVLSEEE